MNYRHNHNAVHEVYFEGKESAAYLEFGQIFMTECKNTLQHLAVNYFNKNFPSYMFDWVLYTPLRKTSSKNFKTLCNASKQVRVHRQISLLILSEFQRIY